MDRVRRDGSAGRRRRRLAVAVAVAVGLLVPAAPPAAAVQDVVVDEFPLYDQPRVMDGRIYAIDSVGDSVVVGGTFSTIREAGDSNPELTQAYLFKFDVSTGRIDQGFRPLLNGDVEGLAISGDGQSVFVAGDFTSVNGQTRNRLVKLSLADGSLDPQFSASVNNRIKDLELRQDMVIVAGRFRRVNGQVRERLAAVDPQTGALLSSFDLPVTVSRDEWAPYVQEMALSDDGRWLVLGGNFQLVGGLDREQIALIDLSGTPVVANWSTDRYRNDCASVYDDTWIRGLDVAPDSSWFVIATTGAYRGVSVLCDTASRWELPPAATGDGQQPTWVQHTGGDTHWAVEVTESAVYAGGHQRWENNFYPSPGGDNDGPGSVARPGIAALDPVSGVPLSWNPGRDRGRGVEAFHATDDYLFVGSDTVLFDGQVRQRLAVLPTAGGLPNPTPESIELPVNLHYATGADLHRVAFDGAEFGASESFSGPAVDGVDWSTVRDGFVQHEELVFFGADQAYYRRPFDGVSFGPTTNLSTSVGYVDTDYDRTPYDQPYDVDTTTAAAYDDGRIFYTRSNAGGLWWRWYSLESGIIQGFEHQASTANWSGATALDLVGSFLYASWDDGKLYRMYVQDGAVDYANRVVVDDGSSGIPWASVDAMFSTQADGTAPPIEPPTAPTCDDPAFPWLAEYFGNRTLAGAPSDVRCEAEIDYDWGTGSPPGTSVGPDDFSGRWTRTMSLAQEGALDFTATSDDGIRISVDGVRVIDAWKDQAPTTYAGSTGALAAGDHEVVVEWYERGGGAVISVDIAVTDAPPGPDTTPPDTAVSQPSPQEVLTDGAVTVVGTATDDRGVAAVDVAIQDTAANLWLQGDGTWGTTFTTRPAVLDSAGMSMTTWTLDLNLSDGSYAVDARATDTAGLTDGSSAWTPFSVDTTPADTSPPDAQVTSPTPGQVVSSSDLTIEGSATDDVGIATVTVAVRDTVARRWLQSDGSTWGSGYHAFDASLASPGATTTTWSLGLTLPDGSYAVDVKAYDTSGNRDPSPPWVRFDVLAGGPDGTPRMRPWTPRRPPRPSPRPSPCRARPPTTSASPVFASRSGTSTRSCGCRPMARGRAPTAGSPRTCPLPARRPPAGR